MASTTQETEEQKTVVFFHPDLGIGGAERLVVDAAVGLQQEGWKVVVFTSHCDPGHCFEEARDGTLDVRVRGNTMVPANILGRFSILCAILRQVHLILQISFFTNELSGSTAYTPPGSIRPTAFFVDQLSAGLPLLSLLHPTIPILFYCHFPDLLLARGREAWWKRLYRVPFDSWEEWSMGWADGVAVNSRFTRGIVRGTWKGLEGRLGGELRVVYPCIDTKTAAKKGGKGGDREDGGGLGPEAGKVLLSVNRFERKKDVALAINAFAGLSEVQRKGARLVIAGGYDNRVQENVSYHQDLVTLAESLGLRTATTSTVVTALAILHNTHVHNQPSSSATSTSTSTPASPSSSRQDVDVLFLLSIPSPLKTTLLRSSTLLIYTPSNEHFGIVPLEAMLAGTPVLAANSGGPTETVVDGETGWLRDPEDVEEWTGVMDLVLNGMSDVERRKMGEMGRKRVEGKFGLDEMAGTLDGVLGEIGMKKDKEVEEEKSSGRTSHLAYNLLMGGAILMVALAVALAFGVDWLRRHVLDSHAR